MILRHAYAHTLCHERHIHSLTQSSDGKKFLSFVFTLEDVLHAPIVQTMKCFLVGGIGGGAGGTGASGTLPITPKDIAEAYAEILLRAWKDLFSSAAAMTASLLTRDGDGPLPGSGPGGRPRKNKRLQEELEQEARREQNSWTGTEERSATLLASFEVNVMQVLLHDAVHASNLKYFKGLFTILQGFHNEKSARGMDSFLIKIYSPIIWRSLKCTNAMVRAQATTLFCDVFPLRANNTSAAEDDECMQRHFNVFTLLLKDSDHRVRSSAVTGICKVLRDFWEPIPPSIANTILSYMINTLSKDSSCANVRVAVVAGLRMLLEQCPLSHVTLRSLLPFLSNSLHDTSEKVRLEFVILLNSVKDVRDMHFYDIVPPEQLLQRLVVDCNKQAICSTLTSLLLANFYPQQMPIAAPSDNNSQVITPTNINDLQLHRCLALIQQDVRSAVAFYFSLHKHVSLGSTTKFAVNLLVSFNSEMDEIYETIDSVLAGCCDDDNAKTLAKNERTKHVLVKSLVPTLEVPVGMLQVLLGILLSIKEKLRATVISSENSGTADLYLKYFTSTCLRNMFQLLQNASNALFQGQTERSSSTSSSSYSLGPQLFAKFSVMWSLYLQLVSVCTAINPTGFPALVTAGTDNMAATAVDSKNKNKNKRSKKQKNNKEEEQVNLLLVPSWLYPASVQVFSTATLLLDNVDGCYANIIQMVSLSLLDAMCALGYETIVLENLIQNIAKRQRGFEGAKRRGGSRDSHRRMDDDDADVDAEAEADDTGGDSDDADGPDMSITAAVCLLSNLLENQRIEYKIQSSSSSKAMRTAVPVLVHSKNYSSSSYACSMLIHFGFPQYLVHLQTYRESRVQHQQHQLLLQNFFTVCASYIEKHPDTTTSGTNTGDITTVDEEAVTWFPTMIKCVLLWVSYSLQSVQREILAQLQLSGGGGTYQHDDGFVDAIAAPALVAASVHGNSQSNSNSNSDSNNRALEALNGCLQWVSDVLVPLLCTAITTTTTASADEFSPTYTLLVDLLTGILGLVGDFFLVSSVSLGGSSASDSYRLLVTAATNNWLGMLISSSSNSSHSDGGTSFLHCLSVELQRLCFLVTAAAGGDGVLVNNNSNSNSNSSDLSSGSHLLARRACILLTMIVDVIPAKQEALTIGSLIANIHNKNTDIACRMLVCVLFTLFYLTTTHSTLMNVSKAGINHVPLKQFLSYASVILNGYEENNETTATAAAAAILNNCMKSMVRGCQSDSEGAAAVLLRQETTMCISMMAVAAGGDKDADKDMWMSEFLGALTQIIIDDC